MEASEDRNKFKFVVSTPDYDASKQDQTRDVVRRHVMRPYRRKKRTGRAIVLDETALAEYQANRQYQSMATQGSVVLSCL